MPAIASVPAALAPPAPASRIRLRATQHCRMLGLMLLLMVVAAINYQSNAAWGLVMALACAVALSALHARRNLAGVTVAAGMPAPVFAGEPRRFGLSLSAASSDAFDIAVSFPELRIAAAPVAVAAG